MPFRVMWVFTSR